MGKKDGRKMSVANTRYYIGAMGDKRGEDSFEHGAAGIEECCRRVREDVLDRRHRDLAGLSGAIAGAWHEIAKEDVSGLSGMEHQAAYFSGVASAMGLKLDTEGMRHSMPTGRWDLENAVRRNLSVADPEIAAGHLEYLGDGVDRDGFGRELAENGRPAGFERMTPGAYLAELNRDNERILAKREQAMFPEAGPEPQDEKPAAKPGKKGAFARLKATLVLPEDDCDGPEDAAEGPAL